MINKMINKGFKKFSDIKRTDKIEEIDPNSIGVDAFDDHDIPMHVNLPKNTGRVEKFSSRENIIPIKQDVINDDQLNSNVATNEHLDLIGKVAKFPMNTKASKAFNFLENTNMSKKSIWYILVEKHNELQMVKYNVKEGVDLLKFVNGLKDYYISKNTKNIKLCEAINSITIDGNDKFSMIKNIPNLKIEDKYLITKITEDLVKLLSK